MLLCPISLYDALTVTAGGQGGVTCNWPRVPTDETNTVVKALRWWFQRSGRPAPPLSIHIEKTIPSQAGLGGGSSDAGALLRWLADREGIRWDAAMLAELARAVGADVPFFVVGRAARVGGIGEWVLPLESIPELHLVLVKPPVAVSTPQAYRAYDRYRSPHLQPLGSRDGAPRCFNCLDDLIPFVENDLEPVVAARHPPIGEAREALVLEGARVAMMTGSGSAVFGIFADAGAGRRAADRITKTHPDWEVFCAVSLGGA